MKARFVRATNQQLGIRFEPEIFEEQLLLESFSKHSSEAYTFRFNGWEHNNSSRTMREGLTSVYGEVVREQKLANEELAHQICDVLSKHSALSGPLHAELLALMGKS